ncbi:GNAT family N-acetyltransferase [Rhizobium sp. K102]|uniref:GNAT family N-acetyltransferase n=1 Tax=Rhizobium sp. K102 TaxID=2918527 RepID=UPI001EFBEDEE|nr:GNAT family N-acetyltransferase [Rhizobium sp. K102]ULR47245.1 GNAT family N-acetyltransferase [Rhizobium sp. K102]
MSALTSESRFIDSFETRIADIDSVDIDKLHALSMSVAWPHRREDWQFLRDFGQGIAAIDEIGRILGSAMWFPYGDRFATIGMVITSPRLQANGAGQWLMGHALDQVAGRNLGLNATRAARRLFVLIRAGRIEAFSLCRRFGRGHVIGPVVASNHADAIAVVHPHAVEHAGAFLRLDTREKGGTFAGFLSRCGLPIYDIVTTMSRGDPWLPVPGRRGMHEPKTYALVSHTLG